MSEKLVHFFEEVSEPEREGIERGLGEGVGEE